MSQALGELRVTISVPTVLELELCAASFKRQAHRQIPLFTCYIKEHRGQIFNFLCRSRKDLTEELAFDLGLKEVHRKDETW